MNKADKSFAVAAIVTLMLFLFAAWWMSRRIESKGQVPTRVEAPLQVTPCGADCGKGA